MLKYVGTAFGIAATTAWAIAPAFADRARLDVPVVMEASDLDPCSNGVVTGLDPRGDGFLAVKSGPGLSYRRIDKLFNGEKIYVCGRRGDWMPIVYSRRSSNCNVTSPWVKTLPYTGPCLAGWVHRRWVEVWAG
jgi:hypothetical protein